MATDYITFPFPFLVDSDGRISATGGDDAVRGKILQVLFTTPGERVHRPDFGCGLLDLVFEPSNPVLQAAAEFTIGQALTRWLPDDILVDAVNVDSGEERIVVEVVYTRRMDLVRQAVRVHFR